MPFSSLTFKMPTKTNLKKIIFCLLLFEGTFKPFFKDIKVKKKSQSSGNQGFCLVIEGSESRRPKNMDLTDPDSDPDPVIFVIGHQVDNKRQVLKKSISAYYFLKVHLHHFSKM